MNFVAAISLAASLRLRSVESFPLAPSTAIASTKKFGASTPTAVSKPRSYAPSPLFALFFTDDAQADLEEIKEKYAKITKSLDKAKKREDEAQENVDIMLEERAGGDSETEKVISRLKRDLSAEMSDLSDKIEGAQDDLRKTVSRTRSEISNIRGEVSEREERLYSEISDLEYRLAALRKEAKNAAKERDSVKTSTRKDERNAGAASRKELEEAKREAFKEKKELTRESWALESRIQQAKSNLAPAKRELEEAERRDASLPSISSLKEALMDMNRKMMPQVEELKEKLAASEMFFDQSLTEVKRGKKDELLAAKSAYEGEVSAEDMKLGRAASDFDLQLEALEKELQLNIELASKPVESFGEEAIAVAANNRVALNQDKIDAIASLRDAWDDAMKKVAESHSAIRHQYGAEYENEVRNLKEQGKRGNRRLEQEDKRRERRKRQLKSEMAEVTRKLSQMMQDERAAAKEGYQSLKLSKSTELVNNIAQSKEASNEIQTMKSNLNLVEYELRTLRLESQKCQGALSELDKERASFRKLARRTVAVAIGKITRRGVK